MPKGTQILANNLSFIQTFGAIKARISGQFFPSSAERTTFDVGQLNEREHRTVN